MSRARDARPRCAATSAHWREHGFGLLALEDRDDRRARRPHRASSSTARGRDDPEVGWGARPGVVGPRARDRGRRRVRRAGRSTTLGRERLVSICTPGQPRLAARDGEARLRASSTRKHRRPARRSSCGSTRSTAPARDRGGIRHRPRASSNLGRSRASQPDRTAGGAGLVVQRAAAAKYPSRSRHRSQAAPRRRAARAALADADHDLVPRVAVGRRSTRSRTPARPSCGRSRSPPTASRARSATLRLTSRASSTRRPRTSSSARENARLRSLAVQNATALRENREPPEARSTTSPGRVPGRLHARRRERRRVDPPSAVRAAGRDLRRLGRRDRGQRRRRQRRRARRPGRRRSRRTRAQVTLLTDQESAASAVDTGTARTRPGIVQAARAGSGALVLDRVEQGRGRRGGDRDRHRRLAARASSRRSTRAGSRSASSPFVEPDRHRLYKRSRSSRSSTSTRSTPSLVLVPKGRAVSALDALKARSSSSSPRSSRSRS